MAPLTQPARFRQSIVMLAIATVSVGLGSRANAACGEVAIAKGDIKIESAKEKKISAATAGTKICQGDTVIAGPQSRAKIKMEDGNELNISPDSRITLETYDYKPMENKKKVMLNVLYGKVRTATREENMYNDKAKDGQANTFQVKTKSAVAGVRGTDFLTSFDRTTSKSEILTFKGQVEVGQPGPGGSILNPVRVNAGEKTEALPGAPPAPPKPVPPKEMEKAGTDSKTETASAAPAAKDKDAAGGKSEADGSATDGTAKKDEGKKEEPKRDAQARQDEPKKDDAKRDEPKREEPNARRDEPQGDGGKGSSAKGPAGGDGGSAGGRTAANEGSGGSSSGSPGGTPGGSPRTGGPASVDGARAPAGNMPMPGGSMIDRGDLALGPGPGLALPPTNAMPVFIPPVINQLPPPPPVCTLCQDAIVNNPGTANVKVNIVIGN